MTIININDFVANANRIIRQLIQNTNQLSTKINEFQTIHNEIIVFINDLKKSMITKKNLNIQFNQIMTRFDKFDNNNNNIELFKSFKSSRKEIVEKFLSNSISSHLFQSISQVYFNSYEQQNVRNQTFRLSAFNNQKKFSTFADDFHQKRRNFSEIKTYDYEKRRSRSVHRD